MRITKDVVERAARAAYSFTLGDDKFLEGEDNIFDSKRWIGRGSNQKATAYYVGILIGWESHTRENLPEEIRDFCTWVQKGYTRNKKALSWEKQGRLDAVVLSKRRD